MAMPVEHEEAMHNRAFTRIILAHWPGGHGPLHHGEDFLPIHDCVLIRQRLEQQIATGHMFSLMISASWRAERDDWTTQFHMQLPKFNISPATVGGEAYNYVNVLRAIKEAYAKTMMERTNEGSRVHLEELTEVRVQIAPNVAQNSALARNTVLRLNGAKHIELPKVITNKKATLNIQNHDTQCFRACILAWKMYHTEDRFEIPQNAERWNNYLLPEHRLAGGRKPRDYRPRYLEEGLDWHNIPFDRVPNIDEIAAFEEDNDLGIYIWVWFAGNIDTGTKTGAKRAREERLVSWSPVRTPSKTRPEEREIQLLLYENHYILITNFQWLTNEERNAVNTSRHGTCLCYRGCGERFDARRQKIKGNYQNHLQGNCMQLMNMPSKRASLPEEKDAILKFKAHAKRQEVPCVAYFDFETAMVPKDERRGQTQVVAHNDQVLSVAFAAVGRDGYEVPKEFLREDYSGTDPEIWLIFRFLALARDYLHHLKYPVPIQMTPEDEERFVNANECHLCGETLCDDRVRDHNHFTGKFRGAAHTKCNLEYKLPKRIMVYAWNLAGFDGHIIVKAIARIRQDPGLQAAFAASIGDMRNVAFDMDGIPDLDDEEYPELPDLAKLQFTVVAKTDETYPSFCPADLQGSVPAHAVLSGEHGRGDLRQADGWRGAEEAVPHHGGTAS